MLRTLAILAVAALAALPSDATAQRRRYHDHSSEGTLTYSVGLGIVDDGVYQDSVARPWALRIAAPVIGRILVGEIGLGGLSAKTASGERERFLIPEAQLQLQLPLGPFRPYAGVGAGWVFGPRTPGAALAGSEPTISTAVGLRTFLSGDRLMFNLETRVRGFGRRSESFGAEFTAGIGITM
jgi:hypothetical protein